MPLDGLDGRQEALAVETVGVQLPGRLVGGDHQHHAVGEQFLQQASEQDGIADVADEQLVEAQHTHLGGQFVRQALQRIGSAGQLEQAAVHPTHEMMEMLAARGQLQGVLEAIHQPGLAPPHRPPEVHAVDRLSGVQGPQTVVEQRHGVPLSRVGNEALMVDGVAVQGSKRRGHGTASRRTKGRSIRAAAARRPA